ncbi:hypothetical protein HanPI659440_Chr06g0236691 [Helianthus annuus]|nr:hypothetical protein HanPI659440_Chr06g0236691 [Helianthus annuus]
MCMADFCFRISFRYNFRSVRVSVFASVMCLHLFSVTVSVLSQLSFVVFFSSADMTLLLLLISPLLSNFWLSRIFLFVFFLLVLQVIWDDLGFQ